MRPRTNSPDISAKDYRHP